MNEIQDLRGELQTIEDNRADIEEYMRLIFDEINSVIDENTTLKKQSQSPQKQIKKNQND